MAENRLQVTSSYSTGVAPLRPQVRRTLGRWENPASSQKTSVAPVFSAPF